MKVFRSAKVFRIGVLALLLAVTLPTEAFGQGRGRRVGIGLDKKCSKFVNCHDARDGRWDGRGPNRRLSIWDRVRMRRHRRIDNDDDFRRGRRRNRDLSVWNNRGRRRS